MAKNVLRFGSTGSAVKLVQEILNEHPKPTTWVSVNSRQGAARGSRSWPASWPWPLTPDGSFGEKTEAAVEAFQNARGLVPDGIVGGNTWAALLEGRSEDDTDAPAPPTSRVELVPVGSRLLDSYPFSLGGTPEQARAMAASGVDGFIGYLGVMNKARYESVLDAGLGFIGVTLANRFDGAAAVRQAAALGNPATVTLGLDLEGRKILKGIEWPILTGTQREVHVKEIWNACFGWKQAVASAGYKTMLYVGSPQPFTTKELTDLGFDGYWNALSRESDRNGALAEPISGWNIWQMIPELYWRDTGVWSDVNFVGWDFRKRLPSWAKR